MCNQITIHQVRIRPGNRTKYTTEKGRREGIWGLGNGWGAYNARMENLDSVWKEIKDNRAIITVDSFSEKGNEFRQKGGDTYLAALYDLEGDFVILTQDSIGDVKQVHPRMPILIENMAEYLQTGVLFRNVPEQLEWLKAGPTQQRSRAWMDGTR